MPAAVRVVRRRFGLAAVFARAGAALAVVDAADSVTDFTFVLVGAASATGLARAVFVPARLAVLCLRSRTGACVAERRAATRRALARCGRVRGRFASTPPSFGLPPPAPLPLLDSLTADIIT